MPAATEKHSLTIAGHRTSISLEPAFWAAFRAIANQRGKSISQLARTIDATRQGNLSSAIRVFVLEHYRARADDGVRKL